MSRPNPLMLPEGRVVAEIADQEVAGSREPGEHGIAASRFPGWRPCPGLCSDVDDAVQAGEERSGRSAEGVREAALSDEREAGRPCYR